MVRGRRVNIRVRVKRELGYRVGREKVEEKKVVKRV